jgi:hypothetical protein
MRRRALLLVLLSGALAVGGAVAFGAAASTSRDTASTDAVLTRADFVDASLPSATPRGRDVEARDHGTRGDLAGWAGIAAVLALAAGWWVAAERPRRRVTTLVPDRAHSRAPPTALVIVHC